MGLRGHLATHDRSANEVITGAYSGSCVVFPDQMRHFDNLSDQPQKRYCCSNSFASNELWKIRGGRRRTGMVSAYWVASHFVSQRKKGTNEDHPFCPPE